MKLSNIERKLIMLALDKGAEAGEVATAALKVIESFRKRYESGVALIKDMEGDGALSDVADILRKATQPQPEPYPFMGASRTRPFGQTPPNPYQPRPWPSDNWQDIMQEAQRRARERMGRAQQSYEDYMAGMRQQYQQQAQYQANAFQQAEWARQQQATQPPPQEPNVVPTPPKPKKGWFRQIIEDLT